MSVQGHSLSPTLQAEPPQYLRMHNAVAVAGAAEVSSVLISRGQPLDALLDTLAPGSIKNTGEYHFDHDFFDSPTTRDNPPSNAKI